MASVGMTLLREDALVVGEFKKGDPRAFEKIFDQFYSAVCYFILEFVKDPEISRDIVSEVFMKLWDRKEDFDNMSSIKSFLYVSAKNAALNLIRRSKVIDEHRKHAAIEMNREELDDVVHNRIFDAEVLRYVNTAIETLPSQCKRILNLTLQGFNTDDIALRLNLSAQTVRNTRARATMLLKKKLSGDVLVVSTLTAAILNLIFY
jgi:RNA polymerase sigma-70 factor (family 1)